MNIQSRIVEQNRQWRGESFPTPTTERDLIADVYRSVDSPLITFLTGPRRVGKSVLLKQIINKLLQNDHVEPNQILFFEFAPKDKSDLIWEIYQYYQDNVGLNVGKQYVFFDELQMVEGFEGVLKEIYDNRDPQKVKIFVTGSPSLSYKRVMRESLAGRYIQYRMWPLSFSEYLRLLDSPFYALTMDMPRDNLTRMGNLEQLNIEFKQFLAWGRLPQMLTMGVVERQYYLDQSIGQAVIADASEYFAIKEPRALKAMFEYVCQNNGAEIVKDNLATVAGISPVTIASYLDALELMGLIYPIYNSTNPVVRLNSARKIYVNSMFGLRNTKYDPETAYGYAVESYVLERLLAQNKQVTFFRSRNKEVDFVMPHEKLAYEVKYRRKYTQPKVVLPDYELKVVSYNGSDPACLW